VTGIVVADAGPLIALSRIDRLALLKSLYGLVVVPTAVFSELRVDSDRPGARTLSAAFAEGAIRLQPLAAGREDEVARLSRVLDPGEASAILLAEQLQARFLLMDERRGRQVARARGLRVVGVAGVLLVAKRAGLLASVGAALTELSRHQYRLSDALVQEVLHLAGELRTGPSETGTDS
jgi:predicted nucleic acid-binding protein